jgi:hypothetical protein
LSLHTLNVVDHLLVLKAQVLQSALLIFADLVFVAHATLQSLDFILDLLALVIPSV